jgi:arsenate reductase
MVNGLAAPFAPRQPDISQHLNARERAPPVVHCRRRGLVCRAAPQPPDDQERGAMAMAVTIYGIRNCDTMKKARAWLDAHGVAYAFHDYKAAGIARGVLEGWARTLGWETLLNRAGTTFRKLPEKDRDGLDADKAVALMLAEPSMIRRPVLDVGGRLLVGFRPAEYEKAFGARR